MKSTSIQKLSPLQKATPHLQVVVKILSILLIMAITPVSVIAKDEIVQLTGFTMAFGGSCETGFPKVLAGSKFFLYLTNSADEPAKPLTPGWPEGYKLEAALDRPVDQPFISTTGLIEQLSPTRYLSGLNLMWDRILRQGDSSVTLVSLNCKCFVLTIPYELGGHTLSFRALWNTGSATFASISTNPIPVIAPCDRSDTARVLSTRILEAVESGNRLRAMEIADTLIAQNYLDASGLYYAHQCALGYKQWDKALSYVDLLYSNYGVCSVEPRTANPPRFNPQSSRDAETQKRYERYRSNIHRSQKEYEQQQHEQTH